MGTNRVYHCSMKWIAAFLAFGMANLAVAAAPKATVEAKLNWDALHAGQQAVAAVVVHIPEGYHAQSATPSDPNYKAFTVAAAETTAVTMLAAVYPAGQDQEYPELGKLNVYTGQVIAYVPLLLASDAPVGQLNLGGTVHLQMCDDHVCFAPATLSWVIETKVVPASETAAPANGELFKGFDPRVFATSAGIGSNAPPISPVVAPAGSEIQFFGWTFHLGNGQYALAFAVAFVVGIIFNLMPCVLPVVPLKALGFYEASQHNRARCLLLGVIFSLGLLSVFAILAMLVVVQHQAWGQLFSEGWFVWSITGILVIMAIGQLGAYSVILPNSLYSYVPSHSSLLGNYLFGGFTAILSTPCTAPMFVGLLAWAGIQPVWVGVLLITNVGLGMAFPYLLLAAYPELARKIPRTGAWSELLKQFMGFLLLAVAAWFAAGRLVAGNGYFWIIFGIVAVGCVFLIGRTAMLSRTPRAIGIASGIALVLAGGVLWFTLKLTGADHELIPWQAYTAETFASASRGGQVVMLEFTANWCANCKELESRVFTDPKAAEAVRRLGVTPIRADLTTEDAAGWPKLQMINASGGIPLTVIYSGKLAEPIQLSSIYTTANLINALEKAKGSK